MLEKLWSDYACVIKDKILLSGEQKDIPPVLLHTRTPRISYISECSNMSGSECRPPAIDFLGQEELSAYCLTENRVLKILLLLCLNFCNDKKNKKKKLTLLLICYICGAVTMTTQLAFLLISKANIRIVEIFIKRVHTMLITFKVFKINLCQCPIFPHTLCIHILHSCQNFLNFILVILIFCQN